MHICKCVYQILPVLSQDTEKYIESSKKKSMKKKGQHVPYKVLLTQIIDT